MRKPAIITPTQFRKAANSVLSKRNMQKRLESQWEDKFGAYTEAWEGQTDGCGFYNQLGRILAHKCQQQYGGIGAVYYKKRSAHTGAGCLVEFISLAMEHEHDPGRSGIAMNRLAMVNAPLKVLTTYVNSKDEGDYLENYANQLRPVERAMSGFSAQQQHVAMLCHENKSGWCWKYHLFNGKVFEEM